MCFLCAVSHEVTVGSSYGIVSFTIGLATWLGICHETRMPISTRQFVGSTLALLAIGFFALCAILGTNVWLGERAGSYARQVLAARDVRATAVDLRAALQTAESSQRGYLYTSNEIYLAPYDLAKERAQKAATKLPTLITAYPNMQAALTRLMSTVSEKTNEMDALIRLKQSRDDAGALALVRTNRGKLLMDEANLFINGIVLAADGRLAELVEEQTENAVLLRWVSIIGGVVILAAAFAAILTIAKYFRELSMARTDLSLANDRLEYRVTARTAELAVANTEMREARDRAETLLAEVNHRVANSLTLVASLIGLQTRSLQSNAAKTALEEARARVHAIAMVHRRLYDGGDVREVALDEYLSGLLEQFKTTANAGYGISLTCDFEPLKLKTDASINLGIVVTEWVMNAFKYAYPAGSGEVRVALKKDDSGSGVLRVEDDGVGRNAEAKPQGTGVGTRIVTAMAASMGGEIDYVVRSPGTTARLSFPLMAA
jgi:two-component sensor histidine kinase